MRWRVLIRVLVLACLPITMAVTPTGANADLQCRTVTVTKWVRGVLQTVVKEVCSVVPDTTVATTSTRPDRALTESKCATDTTIEDILSGKNVVPQVCDAGGGGQSDGQPIDWAAVALTAFRDTAIPTSQVVIAPPGGKTLVNFDTLFSTEADGFTRTLRMLGSRIQLRIEPDSFTWVAGNGEQFTTAEPGVAYDSSLPMSAYIKHRYVQTAEALQPRVDVTWSAQYRVGNGTWLPVAGTVTTTGESTALKVIEAESRLLAAR